MESATSFVTVTAEPTIFKIEENSNKNVFTNTDALNLVAGHQYTIILEGDGTQFSTFVWEN